MLQKLQQYNNNHTNIIKSSEHPSFIQKHTVFLQLQRLTFQMQLLAFLRLQETCLIFRYRRVRTNCHDDPLLLTSFFVATTKFQIQLLLAFVSFRTLLLAFLAFAVPNIVAVRNAAAATGFSAISTAGVSTSDTSGILNAAQTVPVSIFANQASSTSALTVTELMGFSTAAAAPSTTARNAATAPNIVPLAPEYCNPSHQ